MDDPAQTQSPRSLETAYHVAHVQLDRGFKNDRETLRFERMSKNNLENIVKYWVLIALSSLILLVSFISSSLLGRYYFVGGGKSIWLYTLSQSVAFPIPGLILIFLHLRSQGFSSVSIHVILLYMVLGALYAFGDILYSWSVSYLPISTIGLLASTHLPFTAIFAFGLVKKRLTPFSSNTIVVVTLGATLVALNSGSDCPPGTSKKNYIIGFVMSLLANMVYGLLLPLMELLLDYLVREDNVKFTRYSRDTCENQANLKRKKKPEYVLLIEMQTFTTAFATAFVFIGLFSSSSNIQLLHEEVVTFKGGTWRYWMSLVGPAIGWQVSLLATLAVIILTSSLYAGVLTVTTLPFLSLGGVFFFHDHFGGSKAIALALSLWGFLSYLYGGYVDSL